jgi:hypothetical protein
VGPSDRIAASIQVLWEFRKIRDLHETDEDESESEGDSESKGAGDKECEFL